MYILLCLIEGLASDQPLNHELPSAFSPDKVASKYSVQPPTADMKEAYNEFMRLHHYFSCYVAISVQIVPPISVQIVPVFGLICAIDFGF